MQTEMLYRRMARCDGVLRGITVSADGDAKNAEGYIFVLNCKIVLIDGDTGTCSQTAAHLRRIREQICPGGSVRVNWVLSAWHPACVEAMMRTVLFDAGFGFEDIYLPPIGKTDGEADVQLRERLISCLRAYQPKVGLHPMAFAADGGFRAFFDFAGARVTVMPPDGDFLSAPMTEPASDGLRIRISYAGNRLLLTGSKPLSDSLSGDAILEIEPNGALQYIES